MTDERSLFVCDGQEIQVILDGATRRQVGVIHSNVISPGWVVAALNATKLYTYEELMKSHGQVGWLEGKNFVRHMTDEESKMRDAITRLNEERWALQRKIENITEELDTLRDDYWDCYKLMKRREKWWKTALKNFKKLETAFADTVWALTRGGDEHPQKETPDLPDRG